MQKLGMTGVRPVLGGGDWRASRETGRNHDVSVITLKMSVTEMGTQLSGDL